MLILLLILFGKDTIRRVGTSSGENRPVSSDNIAKVEHIPGMTEGGSAGNPSPAIPDKIQENAAPEAGAEQITPKPQISEEPVVTKEPETNEQVTQEPEADAEQTTSEPEDVEEPVVTERVIDPDLPMVALTFDDGPYRNNTKALLDLFETYDSRATFFVVGYHLDVFYEDTLEAYRRGFQIGNHTTNHPSLDTLSNEAALEEILSLNRKLNDMGIPGDVMVRPPYGLYTDYLKEHLTVPMIGWNVDSEDWRYKDADRIYTQIVGKVKDGDIVLLHDLHDVTAEAMQRVVPELVAQGFQLVTVEELFRAKGIEPQAGKYYFYIR